jgi:hypothetical protein
LSIAFTLPALSNEFVVVSLDEFCTETERVFKSIFVFGIINFCVAVEVTVQLNVKRSPSKI